jgi:tRNA pseudouridine38-40 synthase
MPTYKLTIAYDGTHYGGWQVQPNAPSIQALLQDALSTTLRTPILATGSGRTDAGVHALSQTAHFSFEEVLDLMRLRASLAGLLPHDIRVKQIETVPDGFHARYSAKGKIYHYHLHLESNPFKRLYSAHIQHPVDLDLLQRAAALFVGTHDFTSFASQPDRGSAARDPVRTLKRLDVILEPDGIRLEFEGTGFLYKMVRNIVGTLLEVSSGKRTLEDISQIFSAKDRKRAGKTAPPHGLFLMEVIY